MNVKAPEIEVLEAELNVIAPGFAKVLVICRSNHAIMEPVGQIGARKREMLLLLGLVRGRGDREVLF